MSSITIDTNEFADPNFNPKSWINSVLKPSTSATDEESEDDAKNATIIVTKLQMASEVTSRQFDQLSNTVLKSMPRILYDLQAISEHAKTTHNKVEEIRQDLGLMEGHTEQVINNLRRPHTAKIRMEECRMILLDKSDHLNKLKEAQEQKKREEQLAKEKAEAEAEAERAAAVAKAEAEAEAEAREAEAEIARLKAAAAEAKLVEREKILVKEREKQANIEAQAILMKEKEEKEKQRLLEETSKANSIILNQEEEDDDDEFGLVQLPPLRQPEPKVRTMQQLQSMNNNHTRNQQIDDNNSYLQQISESVSPQVSSVFKRIGVPLDKFWQS